MNSSDYYTAKEIKKLGFKKVGKNLQIKKSAKFFFCKNIVIGNNVVIGAGCTISEKIPSNSVVKNSSDLIIERLKWKDQ